ncbi:interferon phi 2 isoform X2 [Phycodurus eques]|uniref:interferon phi 2 isoform X2 n=1 Tax=Phycodurus eques TaxID=693459 RepID=UPI002ACDDA20|nr:interferon phi 2 isoform X2 [Phycodurus eques]
MWRSRWRPGLFAHLHPLPESDFSLWTRRTRLCDPGSQRHNREKQAEKCCCFIKKMESKSANENKGGNFSLSKNCAEKSRRTATRPTSTAPAVPLKRHACAHPRHIQTLQDLPDLQDLRNLQDLQDLQDFHNLQTLQDLHGAPPPARTRTL